MNGNSISYALPWLRHLCEFEVVNMRRLVYLSGMSHFGNEIADMSPAQIYLVNYFEVSNVSLPTKYNRSIRILTLFYSPQFGPYSENYEAHVHYVYAKVNRRNKYHKSYINEQSID